MNTRSSPSLLSRRGFTTTELMIALGVLSLTMVGVVGFTYQSINIYAYDTGRLLVNHDMRKFTGDMLTDAVYSNYFRIYPTYAGNRSVTNGGVTSDTFVADGGTGDFLVLVYTDPSVTTGVTLVKELTGYYRDPGADGTGPVRRFHVFVNGTTGAVVGATTNTAASPPVYTMYDLLNTYAPTANATANPVVIQIAEGLATGSMFYDFYDRSIMIRAQITEKGNFIRKAVNTYNFTVSPRG